MAISTCTVSGTIKSVGNSGIPNCTIRAYITSPFFHTDGTYIANYQVSTTTDNTGAFSISLIETATISKTMTLEVEYPGGATDRLKNVYTVTIPNSGSATLASLITTE